MDHYVIQIFNVVSKVSSLPILPPAEIHWVTILAALLTPVTACIAVYIAWVQARTSRKKLKLDLYEKRLTVYLATKGYLSALMVEFELSKKYSDYREGISGVRWLYDESMEAYLDKNVWAPSMLLAEKTSKLKHVIDEDSKKKLQAERSEIVNQLHEELLKIDLIFHKYLHIES